MLFFLFIFIMFFIVLSMFLSIVDGSYNHVREILDEQEDFHDPITQDLETLVGAIHEWFGTGLGTGLIDGTEGRTFAVIFDEHFVRVRVFRGPLEARGLCDAPSF